MPSTLIAVLAVAAVASTYRLGHHARPALVRNSEPASSAATVTALARANAAHMAGVSHIRIIESERPFEARAVPESGSPARAERIVTTGLFTRVTETTRDTLLSGKTTRTPVALPTDVADAKRSVTVGQATPGHARSGRTTPGHAQPRTGMSASDRRRLGKAIGGLGRHLPGAHHRRRGRPPHPRHPGEHDVVDLDRGGRRHDQAPRPPTWRRLSDATTATASATAALPAQMANIPTLPTPQQVSTVTGPYVDTLQLYETVLAGTTVAGGRDQADPRPRRPVAQRHRHLRRGAIGQARTTLATFLRSFGTRVTVLQADMTKLQQVLHPAAAHAGSHAGGH